MDGPSDVAQQLVPLENCPDTTPVHILLEEIGMLMRNMEPPQVVGREGQISNLTPGTFKSTVSTITQKLKFRVVI